MNREQSKRLAALKGYQIAALAAITSTVAAVAVLFAVRETVKRWARRIIRADETSRPPGYVTGISADATTDHFSETLIVPGITQSGADIAEHDAKNGRSAEGV